MLINYLKTGWRNIKRYPVFSIVTLSGLFLGLLFTLLISAFIWSEWQVNKTLKNADRQYFLKSIWKEPNMGVEIITFGPLAKSLKENYPSLVENYYRWDGITSVVSKANKFFREGLQVGDSTLLSMYGFKLLFGDPATALVEPYSVVISKDKAIKYFGTVNVLGEAITIQSFSGSTHPFKITGVLEEVPRNSVTWINSQNHNEIFIPTNTQSYFGRQFMDNWNNAVIPSYIELKKGVKPSDLEKPIQDLLKQNTIPFVQENLKVVPVPLTSFYRNANNQLVTRMVYTLAVIAFFILLMGMVNFINLSIGKAGSRLKEIGIRKVLGGLKNQLIGQFLVESIILVAIATLLAIFAYTPARPYFSEMVGKDLPSLFGFPTWFLVIPLLLIFFLGMVAGIYPAIVLSSMKSADSIKGKLKTIGEKIWLRKALVGFQFCIALIVLVAMLVVTNQVSHFFGNGLGYNKEFVVSAQVPRDWSSAGVRKMETIRDEFETLPSVKQVTLSYEIPNGMNGGQSQIYRLGSDSTQAVNMDALVSDGYYSSTYEISIKAGTFFNTPTVKDSSNIVLNEKAAKALGFENANEAIGNRVRVSGSNVIHTIQGVVSDFHFGSMQSPISSLVFFPVRFVNGYRFLSFKIKPGNINQSLAAIQRKWAELMPGSAFEFKFMDDYLEEIYATELQLKKAAITASLLALAIMLLGVVGLVTFSIQKRTREIGIRKVLGASVPAIQRLFIRDFLPILGFSALVACPISYLIMNEWLNDYADRISLSPLIFLYAIGLLGVITITLILVQTLKAANNNPVNTLKIE